MSDSSDDMEQYAGLCEDRIERKKNRQINFRIDGKTLRRLRELQRIERRSVGSLLCVLIDSAWKRSTQIKPAKEKEIEPW